ncbi:MAG TPA: SDR family oxidoreductase, partial [Actinomycetospora sp.]|uniref:SDR family oxidoreductase n=1 Tax=Actinomycetospora sp. TaxID=1872135 RepID=UPI002F410176
PKRYDLMQQINSKGTFQLTRAALPRLFESEDPQVVTLGPPINLKPEWLGKFPSYALSKYGMTLLTLGFAAEFADRGVRANCLWPQTTISTAAVANLLGGDEASRRARSPEIMGDAAVALLTDAERPTGQVFLDVEALARAGVTDLSPYGGGEDLELDFFVDEF